MDAKSRGPGLDMRHARTADQARQMEEIIAKGICPFCGEYLAENHREPVEKKGAWWSVMKNDYPYEGSSLHYLFIYNTHAEKLAEVAPEAFAELAELVQWVEKTHNLAGGTLFMRFGDSGHTGASVAHLHAHLVVGGSESESSKKLKVTVGFHKPD